MGIAYKYNKLSFNIPKFIKYVYQKLQEINKSTTNDNINKQLGLVYTQYQKLRNCEKIFLFCLCTLLFLITTYLTLLILINTYRALIYIIGRILRYIYSFVSNALSKPPAEAMYSSNSPNYNQKSEEKSNLNKDGGFVMGNNKQKSHTQTKKNN